VYDGEVIDHKSNRIRKERVTILEEYWKNVQIVRLWRTHKETGRNMKGEGLEAAKVSALVSCGGLPRMLKIKLPSPRWLR
jgi:hypothetical protein